MFRQHWTKQMTLPIGREGSQDEREWPAYKEFHHITDTEDSTDTEDDEPQNPITQTINNGHGVDDGHKDNEGTGRTEVQGGDAEVALWMQLIVLWADHQVIVPVVDQLHQEHVVEEEELAAALFVPVDRKVKRWSVVVPR